MVPSRSGLTAPDFGSRSPGGVPSTNTVMSIRTSGHDGQTTGLSFSGDSIPPGLAERFLNCNQAHSRLEAGGRHVDVSAPWAGDSRTLPVMAAGNDTGATLADRLLADGSLQEGFRRQVLPVDSITLLTSTGIGENLQDELARRGIPVRVYEATTSLMTESGFVISDGGHWAVYGGRTTTHDLADTYELIRAQQAGFPYADGMYLPGTPTPLADRARTVELLKTALAITQVMLNEEPELLDLTVAAQIFAGHERPRLLWAALMRLLRDRLGDVRRVADLYHDAAGRLQTVDLPIEARRLFTATGQHRLNGGLGYRDVDFNRPQRLLNGAAAIRPAAPEALATWLAESAMDQAALGRPLPPANVPGDGQAVQRQLIARLQALGLNEREARDWAAVMVNGNRDDGLSPQITVAAEPGTRNGIDGSQNVVTVPLTRLEVPLGGGVLRALVELPGTLPVLQAASEVAAHYLHDKTGEEVPTVEVMDIATVSWPVATLVEVVALAVLRRWRESDSESAPPLAAEQSLSVLLAAAGPDLSGFLATHEGVLSTALAGQLSTNLDVTGLFNPEQTSWLRDLSDPVAVITEAKSTGPLHLPVIGLLVDEEIAQQDGARIAAAAHASASVITRLDTAPGGSALTEALTSTSTRSSALRGLREEVNRIRELHPELDAAATALLESVYQRDVAYWLASALADEQWDDRSNSAERVSEIVQLVATRRSPGPDWTAPVLARALGAEWRDVTAADLWRLPVGAVTVVWAQRPNDLEHVILVQRTARGLAVVDVETPSGVQIQQVTEPTRTPAILGGHARVVVNAELRIVTVGPRNSELGPVLGPPRTIEAQIADGLAAPRFDGPTIAGPPDAIQGVPGATRFNIGAGIPVITVDDRTVTYQLLSWYLIREDLRGGLMVGHGRPAPFDSHDGYLALGSDFGFHVLEPAESMLVEPVTAGRSGNDVISPTGWRLTKAGGSAQYDLRGVLTEADLVALSDAPPEPGLVTVALANLHVLLDIRPPWVPSWKQDDEGRALRQAAGAFGDQYAARFSGLVLVNEGLPIATQDLDRFLHIESVAIIKGLASLAFLQEVAILKGFSQLPLQSRLSVSEVVDRLDLLGADFGATNFDARAAKIFFEIDEEKFLEMLAANLTHFLNRRVESDTLLRDPEDGMGKGVAEAPVRPDDPASIELVLLQPGSKRTPLSMESLPIEDRRGVLDHLARYGPNSRSAQDMHNRARSAAGREEIVQAVAAFSHEHHGWHGKPRVEASSPEWLANGVGVYRLEGGQEWANAELTRIAGQMAPPRETLTIIGFVQNSRGRVSIVDANRSISSHQLIATNFESLSGPSEGARRVLVLNLLGDLADVERFVWEAQEHIDHQTLLNLPGPHGQVYGVIEPDTSQTTWYTLTPGTRERHRAPSLDDGVTLVRDQTPMTLDLVAEMRDRIAGHSRYLQLLTPAEITQRAAREALDLPAYSARGGAAIDVYQETEIRVPVRPGASAVEMMDTARAWLNPQEIRETVTPGLAGPTVPVRIGHDLQAHVYRLPATESTTETAATIVSPVFRIRDYALPYQVWVNRHRPVEGHSGPIKMTAVPLRPFVNWSFLDTLPPELLLRLTIEPGRVRGEWLQVGEESVDAHTYFSRLPDLHGQRPIVILTASRRSADLSEFVKTLSERATVIQFVQRGGSDGGQWRTYRDGARIHYVDQDGKRWHFTDRAGQRLDAVREDREGGLAVVFHRWTQSRHSNRERRIISDEEALTELVGGRVLKAGSEAAMVIRRAMATVPLNQNEQVTGFLELPSRSRPSGPIKDLLAQFPAELIVLRISKIDHRNTVTIHVPARYVRTLYRWRVVDLAALVADGAQLGSDGRVTIPPPATAWHGVQLLLEYLKIFGASTRVEETPQQQAGRLFQSLTGTATPEGGSSLSAWAEAYGARFQSATPADLRMLGPGSATLAQTRNKVFAAVGTEQINSPLLITLQGQVLSPASLAEPDLEMLLADGNHPGLSSQGDSPVRRLAQVDLSQPGYTVVDLRAEPGEAAERGHALPQRVVQQVATAIQDGRGPVPGDLARRLSQGLSTSAARRLIAVGLSPSAVDALTQEVMGAPVNEADRRASLLSQVKDYVAKQMPILVPNQSMSPAEVEMRLDLMLRGQGSELDSITDEMVRSISVKLMLSRDTFQATLASGETRYQRKMRSSPTASTPSSPTAALPRGITWLNVDTPVLPEHRLPHGPHQQKLHVIIVNTQLAKLRDVDKALSSVTHRGFLVLTQFNAQDGGIYHELALGAGLKVMQPQDGAAAAQEVEAPDHLASTSGWEIVGLRGTDVLDKGLRWLDRSQYAALWAQPPLETEHGDWDVDVDSDVSDGSLDPVGLQDPGPVALPPDSVRSMTRHVEQATNGVFDVVEMLVNLAKRLFQTGLRSSPSNEAELVDTADWVRSRLREGGDAAARGVHTPHNWGVFSELMKNVGNGGMVLTPAEGGREPAVFLRASDEIWKVPLGAGPAVAERWTEPNPLQVATGDVDGPPRIALALNKCGDPL